MSILRELLPGQHIRIDNHHRGMPMKWDWNPGEQPDDIHLDKEMNRNVNGKKVQVRVTLNKDGGVKVPHAKNKKDQAWIDEYNRVMDEVRNVLEHDSDLRRVCASVGCSGCRRNNSLRRVCCCSGSLWLNRLSSGIGW